MTTLPRCAAVTQSGRQCSHHARTAYDMRLVMEPDQRRDVWLCTHHDQINTRTGTTQTHDGLRLYEHTPWEVRRPEFAAAHAAYVATHGAN